MELKTFNLLVSFAGRLSWQKVRAVSVDAAMTSVRNLASEPAVLVRYEACA